MAVRQSSRFVIPQIFMLTIEEFPKSRFEIFGPHQCLPNEETVGIVESFDILSCFNTAFGNPDRRFNKGNDLFCLIQVYGKRVQITGIYAYDIGVEDGKSFAVLLPHGLQRGN